MISVPILDLLIERSPQFVCRLCQKSFLSRNGLLIHFSIQHREIYDSGMTFIKAFVLLQNMFRIIQIPFLYVFIECLKFLGYQRKYNGYVCGYCGETNLNKYLMGAHVAEFHPDHNGKCVRITFLHIPATNLSRT
jgi:hypothetical protein